MWELKTLTTTFADTFFQANIIPVPSSSTSNLPPGYQGEH